MPAFGFRLRAEESPIDSHYCYLVVTANAGSFGAPATRWGPSLSKCEGLASMMTVRVGRSGGGEDVLAPVTKRYGTHRWRARWSGEVTTLHDRTSHRET